MIIEKTKVFKIMVLILFCLLAFCFYFFDKYFFVYYDKNILLIIFISLLLIFLATKELMYIPDYRFLYLICGVMVLASFLSGDIKIGLK